MFIYNNFKFIGTVFICITISLRTTFGNDEQNHISGLVTQMNSVEPISNFIEEQPLDDENIFSAILALSNMQHRQSSTKKDFHIAENGKNAGELPRDKRSWFFTMKGAWAKNANMISHMRTQHDLLAQKMWQSAPPRRRPSLLRN